MPIEAAQGLAPHRLSAARRLAERAALRRLAGRSLLRRDRSLARPAGLRLRPPVQLRERQQGAALAAELRRLRREGLPLDRETKALLEPMITYSDNRAADADLRTGRRRGTGGGRGARPAWRASSPSPGYWGGDRITAADMARFFYRLDANLPSPTAGTRWASSPGSPRSSAGESRRLSAMLVGLVQGRLAPTGRRAQQRAGHPSGCSPEHRRGEHLALAVLTDEAPWGGGGFEAIEGVARRLFATPPPYRGGWVAP